MMLPPAKLPQQAGPRASCPACATEAPATARFCGTCGMALLRLCPACGTPASPEHRFCTSCGAGIDVGPGGARPVSAGIERQSPSLTREVDGIGAERRLMTVLFCDLVGSSALAARLDPEEFGALLVAYRECCATMAAQHGGYLSRYIGDGVIACFGYPRALGRDAQSAVACGLAIAKEVSALARATHLRGGDALAVRIGIETGLVVAGRLGPGPMAELDALVGTAPNTAARLQKLAMPNGVVIGESTHELVAGDFACEELSTHQLEHLKLPGRAFVVLGKRQVMLARRRAPLVGRATELAMLCERWARACAGHSQTVLLSGEAGIGKSRMVQELLDDIADAPHAFVLLTCTPQTVATALYPAIAALRRALTLPGAQDGEGVTIEAITALAETLGLTSTLVPAVLAEAFGLAPGPVDLLPAERRRLLMQAVEAWLLHHAASQPLLIVAEDLHWSDPSLLELLHGLADLASSRCTMLLATYRSDFVLPWPDRPTTLRVTLPSLDRAEAERLVGAIAHGQTAATREMILARADGVPLFLEEFALAMGAPMVPQTLQQLFTARLDTLGPAKGLAQCAALLGREVEPDLLRAVTGLPEPLIEERLQQLVDAEMMVRTQPPPAASFAFRHALLQQAAAESLLLTDRRALHARAAAALVRLRPALVDQQPELLAEHHAAAEEYAAAQQLYARAARRSLATAALEEAETQVRHGLTAAAALPPEKAAEAELDLQVLLGLVLIARRGYASEVVQKSFEDALRIADGVSDETRILPALRGLASFYQVRGPLSRAGAICDRLVAAAEQAGDSCMLADAWRRRGWNLCCVGRLAESEDNLNRALAVYDPSRCDEHLAVAGDDVKVLTLANLCWLGLPRHGPVEAGRRAEAVAAAAKATTHPISACYGFVFAAFVLQQIGRSDEALHLAEQALLIAEKRDLAYWVALSRVAIGQDRVVRRGDAAAGRDLIMRGLSGYRETQAELLRPFILSLLAEAQASLGELEAAQLLMREAVEVAEALEAYGFLPDLLMRHARLLSCSFWKAEHRDLLERVLATARMQGATATALVATEALEEALRGK